MATSSNKKKATAKERATEKSDNRGGRAAKPKVPTSAKAASKSRFAGERALTGEDRPSTRAGGKTAGAKASGAKASGGKTTTGRTGNSKAGGGGKRAGAKVTGGKTGRSTSAAR